MVSPWWTADENATPLRQVPGKPFGQPLPVTMTIGEACDFFASRAKTHRIYPVVDTQGKLAGIVSRADALLWQGKPDLAAQTRFERRIIPVEEPVAVAWGDLMGRAKRSGRGLSSMDGLIAATAVAHDLTLATRNTKDFEGFGIELVDPWIV
ncbi:CBS domain-containing protein [Rhizobium leguminosarum]|uniref:CBS domain-containing protein n=1 Tax=Rhizobium leguminosarum TaxID=384 RepID=UPI001FDF855B|nr:CBS domain-containing protein [Rhizobium leguminosarum]